MCLWKYGRCADLFLKFRRLRAGCERLLTVKAVTALRHDYSCPEGVSIDDIVNFNIDTAPSPDEEIISREDASLLNQAIQSLPEKCRHVFYLAKIDCMPYKEIALMLGITVATVSYHVGYAMDALRRVLRHD